MPCWFYEKKDLRNTASYQDGISPEVEARYRREGARFILDAGTKMGLYPFLPCTLQNMLFTIFSYCEMCKSYSSTRSLNVSLY